MSGVTYHKVIDDSQVQVRLDELRKRLEAEMPVWISVTDQLPEEEKPILQLQTGKQCGTTLHCLQWTGCILVLDTTLIVILTN